MQVQIAVNIFDPTALHTAAVARYCGYDQSDEKREAALSWLGTADDPNLQNCFAEVVCAGLANDALGFEF